MTDNGLKPDQELMTIGELAEHLDISTHRLKYAIERYKIKPARRFGIIRVWSEAEIPRIKSAIARIAQSRGKT